MTEQYINHDLPARFEAHMVIIQPSEDQIIMNTSSLFQQTASIEEYFSRALMTLLKIRKCILKV